MLFTSHGPLPARRVGGIGLRERSALIAVAFWQDRPDIWLVAALDAAGQPVGVPRQERSKYAAKRAAARLCAAQHIEYYGPLDAVQAALREETV